MSRNTDPAAVLYGVQCRLCKHAAGHHRWIKPQSGTELQFDRKKTTCRKCQCPGFRMLEVA
jgi:hypothetical protein